MRSLLHSYERLELELGRIKGATLRTVETWDALEEAVFDGSPRGPRTS